jgi:competence protein ComGC
MTQLHGRPSEKAKQTAFTLIELLVVIAISRSSPLSFFLCFAQAREKSRQAGLFL